LGEPDDDGWAAEYRADRTLTAGALAGCHGPLWTGIIAWSTTWYTADREVRKGPIFIVLFSILV
ncbi:MAG: hypothetical protein OXH75_00280, partial [Acidobacteria bacterium]|nr:hypothetical protein [Acidobacteriota bacterium]